MVWLAAGVLGVVSVLWYVGIAQILAAQWTRRGGAPPGPAVTAGLPAPEGRGLDLAGPVSPPPAPLPVPFGEPRTLDWEAAPPPGPRSLDPELAAPGPAPAVYAPSAPPRAPAPVAPLPAAYPPTAPLPAPPAYPPAAPPAYAPAAPVAPRPHQPPVYGQSPPGARSRRRRRPLPDLAGVFRRRADAATGPEAWLAALAETPPVVPS